MRLVFVAALAVLTAACANTAIVNNGDPPPETPATAAPPPIGPREPNLVDAHEYYVATDQVKGYYFTTPSGKWNCAILPHSTAGCQAAGGAQALGVTGAPETVRTPDGGAVAPNAIAVGDEGEPGFVWVQRPGFVLASAKALDLNTTLAAAGFRCNVQERTGVSCQNEMSQKGFTFSSDGYLPHYTPVPG